jgi:FAD/FMN-containing dehydrogenase
MTKRESRCGGTSAGGSTNAAIAALVAALPDGTVVTGVDVGARARSYWDPAPLEAAAIVRPRSTEEVATVLRICHAHRQPVVPQGGRTGVCDGERATVDEIVLSLERLCAIEEIDVLGRSVVVQAGCVLERLQQAVAAKGLYLPLDLGARGSCTIGGNAATNAGGINVIRFGMTRSLVLGLEAVLADGTILSSMNRMLKNNSGYDLKHLFIGSEGTLGVVTRVVLSLKEEFNSATSALVALESGDDLARLLKHMDRALGGTLTAFEVMWGDHYRAVTVTGAHISPLPRDYPYYVVMEGLGADAAFDEARFHRALESAVDAGLIADAVVPKSTQERDRIWSIREDFSAILGDRPQYLYDVSLPIRDMMAYVADVRQRLEQRWPGARLYVLGHIGDGNLHFFISPGCDEPNLHESVNAAVYEPLVRYGGAVSAEHGVGLEKKSWLRISRTPAEIATMRLLKRSLDPHNILNPGKIFDAQGDGAVPATGCPAG